MTKPAVFLRLLSGLLFLGLMTVPLALAGTSWGNPFVFPSNTYSSSIAVQNGNVYVAYVKGAGPAAEIYLRRRISGSWRTPARLTYNSTGDALPDIAVGENGKLHIAHLHNNPQAPVNWDLVYRTNKSGAWKATTLTNGKTAMFPALAVKDGKAHIVYTVAGGDKNELWYASNGSGSWRFRRLTTNGALYDEPAVAVGKNGPHIAYTNQMANHGWGPTEALDDEVYYMGLRSGVWAGSRLTRNSTPDANPDIAVDGNGKVHIVFAQGDTAAGGGDYEIIYFTNRSGSWRRTKLTNDTAYDSEPALAVNQGRVFVVWTKLPKDGGDFDPEIYFRTKSLTGTAWSSAQRLTNNSTWEVSPRIAAENGKAYLVYDRWDMVGPRVIFRRQL